MKPPSGLEEAIDGGLALMAATGGGSTRDATDAHAAKASLELRLQAAQDVEQHAAAGRRGSAAEASASVADVLQAYLTLVGCGKTGNAFFAMPV
jgi:hypothetical protein|eukprot:COSAG06_NODE_23850_length_679_cov_2.168966_1_plen_94_part_00